MTYFKMNIIKKVKKHLQKRKDYYFSRYYYRQLVDKYTSSISIYIKIANKINENENEIFTKTPILNNTSITFNTTISKTKKKYGEPIYLIENESIKEVTVLFYRIKFANQKVKCEFHFYKNKLFFVKYIFSYLTDKTKESVLNILENKYLNGSKLNYNKDIIRDESNNKIFINEDSHFNIDYLAFDSDFFKEIKQLKFENELKQKENEIIFLKQISRKL